jgi:hypothetical protein
MSNDNLIITPKTKLFDLLNAYPELEDPLMEYAPSFKKLKNPLLRKTVGKIATLNQVASVGNVEVQELINFFRKKIGQQEYLGDESQSYNYKKPDWFAEEKISETFDVAEMLNRGEHPVNQVLSDIRKLKDDEIYKMIAPFLPAPLVDKATSLNFKHWINKVSDEKYEIYLIAEDK